MARKKKTTKFKLKTHKATAKRFRMTATGKIVRTKGGKSHLRRRSAKRVKRQWDKTMEVGEKATQRRIRQPPWFYPTGA